MWVLIIPVQFFFLSVHSLSKYHGWHATDWNATYNLLVFDWESPSPYKPFKNFSEPMEVSAKVVWPVSSVVLKVYWQLESVFDDSWSGRPHILATRKLVSHLWSRNLYEVKSSHLTKTWTLLSESSWENYIISEAWRHAHCAPFLRSCSYIFRKNIEIWNNCQFFTQRLNRTSW